MTTDMSGNEANGAQANGSEAPPLTDEQRVDAQMRNAQIDSQRKRKGLIYRGTRYDDSGERQATEKIIAARSSARMQPEEMLTYRGVQYSGERYAPDKIRITRKNRSALAQWFNDLPVADKQLAGLLASKMLSVLGVIGVSLLLLSATGRRLVLNQAVSELSVTTQNLTRDLSGPGLSEGVLLEATESRSELEPAQALEESLAQATRGNLRARLETNQLEYIALVDADFRVIASGNTARTSDVFNPNNLVSNALRQREFLCLVLSMKRRWCATSLLRYSQRVVR